MPKASSKKTTKPTLAQSLVSLQEAIEGVVPRMEEWKSAVDAAMTAALELAGVPSANGADNEDEEEPSPKGRRSSKAAGAAKAGRGRVKPAVDDDEEEEDDEEVQAEEDAPDFDDMDEDDLAAFVKKHKLPVKLAKLKGLKKQRAAVEEAYEDAQAEDGDSEADVPDFDSMDADELADFVDEHDLEIDLDDYNNLKKKRAAVAKAYASGGDDEEDDNDDESW